MKLSAKLISLVKSACFNHACITSIDMPVIISLCIKSGRVVWSKPSFWLVSVAVVMSIPDASDVSLIHAILSADFSFESNSKCA